MNEFKVKLKKTGHVTIPKILRDKFRLVPGAKVFLSGTKEGILITGSEACASAKNTN